MVQSREAEVMPNFFVPLNELWLDSDLEELGDWQIHDSVRIGLASANQNKVASVASVLKWHGAELTTTASAFSEKMIKAVLRQTWRSRVNRDATVDRLRVVNTASLKSAVANRRTTGVTHMFALDTDVNVLYPFEGETEGPVGKPENKLDLLRMLAFISGKYLSVKTAAALMGVGTEKVLAVDEVNILLKLKKFNPLEYLSKFGFKFIGKVAGAIDFSTSEGCAFIDSKFPLQVSRIMSNKVAHVDPVKAQFELGEYFQGCPKRLIESVILHGLTAKYSLPFPLGVVLPQD